MGSRHSTTATRERSATATATRPRVGVRARSAGLLIALVAGGCGASLLTGPDVPAATAQESMAVSDMLGADAAGLGGGTEVSAQVAISEVEARARLDQVAATRAERAARDAEAAAVAAEAARPRTVAPVDGARLTSTFAMRWGVMHWGIDLAAPMMTEEYAAADGVVLRAGAASGYGQVVYLLHDNGDVTVYGHMEEILVEPGDYVDAGDTIALLGSRGQSTGPHLHFEVHEGGLDGTRVDPVEWLSDRGVEL